MPRSLRNGSARILRMSNGCWRVDETYARVKGRWTYLSGGRQPRADDRFFVVGLARCGGGEAVLSQGARAAACRELSHPHGRQEPRLSKGSRRHEERRRILAPNAHAAMQISQQHRRARPPAHQAPGSAGARLQLLSNGAENLGIGPIVIGRDYGPPRLRRSAHPSSSECRRSRPRSRRFRCKLRCSGEFRYDRRRIGRDVTSQWVGAIASRGDNSLRK